ncbi:MAG TPA: SDR family NAD(P)-dependent oxidoreductase [Kofleriaceae bacterium]|nr:SDR family NAD(P)-dependent oxidoreductase [Kofleriaceae bacterium]
MSDDPTGGGPGADDPAARLRAEVPAAAALLEELVREPGLLAALPDELRRRLTVAAGQLSRPDRYVRKAIRKGLVRRTRQERKAADAAVLDGTGIRALRRLPIFTSLGAVPSLPPPDEVDDASRAADDEAWTALEAERDEAEALVAEAEQAAADDAGDEDADVVETAVELSADHASGTVLRLHRPRNCYVCKADFHELHPFYDAMCPACAELNWRKRHQTADLRGRVALVTGGRVKIGAQIALKLLRAGAETIIVTRFPVDAARRLAAEPDADELCTRAHVLGCDLRHTPSVEALCAHLVRSLARLDVLINNACQTVRRPSGFYDHLLTAEAARWSELGPREQAVLARWFALRGEPMGPSPADGAAPEAAHALAAPAGDTLAHAGAGGLWQSAVLSQVPLLAEDLVRGNHLFPAGRLDADLQQVDLRDFNSWRMTLADVPTAELLEVHLVNAVAPFVLNARLKPLLAAVPTRDAHVVNVSAMEGQFYRRFKTDKHPHTNMAKAALNMLTRTAAADYVRDGIHMNAVDTGWVTDEDPATIAARKVAVHGFHPPLDIVDGAARVLDPVFDGHATGRHAWGLFLKDYRPTPW